MYARTAGGVRLGLERTLALLEELGNPHRRFRAYHVAGTNGKGSVVATVAAVLTARGLRVGTYTSPHLVDFRERIVVDGTMIPEARVTEFVEQWIETCDRWHATFFEATTALAFAHFAESEVDVAVVETGLGGRFDSTNVLTPAVATVTSIGLDHTDLLGDTCEAIAFEKAGIFKPGVPAVVGERDEYLRDVLAQHARDTGASNLVFPPRVSNIEVEVRGTSFSVEGVGRLRTPLVGAHQARNTATAIAALAAAGDLTETEDLGGALNGVRLSGRFDLRDRYLFDVAHNPPGAVTLAETIGAVDLPRPIACVIGVLADKDWRGIISALAPAVDHMFCTLAPTAPEGRRWDPVAAAAVAAEIREHAVAVPDFDDALKRAAAAGATVLVTGSFHTVGDAMSRLQVSPLAS